MDLDKTEDRYLLAGGADTTLALFDTHSGLGTVRAPGCCCNGTVHPDARRGCGLKASLAAKLRPS